MSLYKHDYRAYTGEVSPLPARIGVLARYALEEVWSSKIAIGLLVFSLLPFLVFLVIIYLANNPIARALILKNSNGSLAIDARFFLVLLQIQSWFALAITSWIAPRVITFDLADNALPILLSHPISRAGYVFGKFLAMFGSLSLVTWIPCLLLWVYQSYTSPEHWVADHLGIAWGLFAGSVVWIAFLSLVGLAISSWVKWRIVATGAIYAAVFVPAGVGGVVSAILRTKWGFLLNIPAMMSMLWQRLIGAPEFMRSDRELSTMSIAVMLILACCACVAMLNARIRAREVVRG
jgi:ABC-type transport system involved in multi-copper enzyme maturation permease subunit